MGTLIPVLAWRRYLASELKDLGSDQVNIIKVILVIIPMMLTACGEGNSVLDTEENRCSATINPNTADSDGDGVINICDLDNDNDGIEDEFDNCPLIANEEQLDTNEDGLGDACDVDNDGIENEADNCPFVANIGQEDANDDGVGDFCDRDGDGVVDANDNCPIDINADQGDEDGNGVGDVCDIGDELDAFSFFEPLNLSNNPGLTFRPSVAFDNNNYIHVVWDDNTGIEGALEVYYSTVNALGFSATEPVKLANNVSGVVGLAQRARIAVAPDDSVHVIWQDTKTNYSDIYHVKLVLNEDTGIFEIVNTVAEGESYEETNISHTEATSVEPAIAIDDEGNIYVAWSSNETVTLSRSSDGGVTWSSAEEQISFPVGVIVEPALYATGDGEVSLVWTELDRLFYTRSNDHGETFSTVRNLRSSTNTMQRADIEIFGNSVYISWDEETTDSGNPEIYLLISNDAGNTFNEVINVTQNEGTSIYSALKVGPTGDIFLAWSDTSSGNYETEFTYSRDGGVTFADATVISPSENGSLVVDMDVNSDNNIVVVWDDNRFESFDTLMAFGATDLPIINDLTELPDFYDPSVEPPILITAALSDPMQWSVEIVNELGLILYFERGLSAGINVFWDGTDLDGEIVEPGLYSYSIVAVNDESVDAVSRYGSFRINDKDSAERQPLIETLITDRAAFSPNSDGRTDTVIATATFNQTLQWYMELHNSSGELMTSESGVGPSSYLEWDGLQENGEPEPEGTYTITTSIVNDLGQSAESSVDVVIDLTPVVVENLQITPVDLSAGTPGNISFHITESAVVTIYIFDETGFTTVNELVRTQLGGGYDGVAGAQDVSYDWNGESGNGILQPPGTYSLRIWVRDFGANLPVEYPIIQEIEIIE
jgi:flagellar hook assembly protein FlgD